MINKNDEEVIYTFSQSRANVFIADHLEKFLLVAMLILAFCVYKGGVSPKVLIFPSIFLSILYYLFIKIHRKVAYKIILNFDSHEVRFHMHRSKEVIKVVFGDLESIRVNGYIIFVLKERKIFYNDPQNRKLLECLNKIIEIDWGFLCAIWGPAKNMRDALDGEWRK